MMFKKLLLTLCVISLIGCERREDKYIRLQKELAEKQNELQELVSRKEELVTNRAGTAPDFFRLFFEEISNLPKAQAWFTWSRTEGWIIAKRMLVDDMERMPEKITDERIRSQSEQLVSEWRESVSRSAIYNLPNPKRPKPPSEADQRLFVEEMSNLLIAYRDYCRTYKKKLTDFMEEVEGSDHEFCILEMDADSLRKEIKDLEALIKAMEKLYGK
ncbi:MAG: hypothetical protein ACON5J_10650 [Rubripirellula sp.]